MITIQGFAKLCGCNAQTLRYYDRIGLLTPARVDQWTGYRYYEESQAVRFVKIKNLQQADFSIEEIKELLDRDDETLLKAFDRKISEQQQKLERIREIQRSYLADAMNMQKVVRTFTDFVKEKTDNPVLWQEFGMDPEKETGITAKVHEMLAGWLAECSSAGKDAAPEADGQQMDLQAIMNQTTKGVMDDARRLFLAREGKKMLKEIPGGAEKVFERDDWEHVSEWINELPNLGNGKQKHFLFRVTENSPVVDLGFPTLALAVMAARFDALNGAITCRVGLSEDGKNHFALYQG